MNNIIKSSLIKENDLDNKYYFKSLVDVAYSKGIIDVNQLNYLQRESIELLKKVTGMLTGNESYTIKYDRAINLLESAYFTVGVYLKACKTPDDAIDELLNNKLSDIFDKGNDLIQNYFSKYKVFYNFVNNNMLKLPNYAYMNSLKKEMDEFFRTYNKDFDAARECGVDYPLCIGQIDLLGIEFVMTYLTYFNYENLILQKYDLKDIYNLLNRISDISSDLIINIFKQVFITTIGEELAGHDNYHLYVDILETEDIFRNLSSRNDEEVEYILRSIINKICLKFNLNDKIKKYIDECTTNIISSIMISIKNDTLDILFGTKSEKIGEI